MKKCKAILIAVFMTIFSLVTPCPGADVAKIGVIDTQKILMTSSAGKISPMPESI